MDQTNSNTSELEQRLAQLPEDVRNAVLSVEWEEHVRQIGERHKLHIDQQGALGDTTLMTMLGIIPLEQYAARLAAGLNLPAADAETIAKEVNDEVFTTIRDSLKRITATPPQASPAPAPATPAKPDLTKADAMLAATAVQTAPPKPQNYAADPYREPPIP